MAELITPAVNAAPDLIMRALDGRTYPVRTRADVRIMAADLYRLAAAYQDALLAAQRRLTGSSVPTPIATSIYASLQAATGDVLRLVGDLYATGDPAWSARPPIALRPVQVDGGLWTLDTPGALVDVGQRLTRDAVRAWQGLGLTAPARATTTPESLAAWVGVAWDRQTMAALPVAYAAGLWVIGIVAGALVVVEVVQAALAWSAPEGAARLESYNQSLEVIDQHYDRQIERCAELTGQAREDCERAALTETLDALDQVNQRARSTLAETIKKVALVLAIASIFILRKRRAP
jgi:hypothetical protein